MSLPTSLKDILKDLKTQHWIKALAEHSEIYIVGGTVRDAFTGKPMKDIDLIVDGLSFDGIQKRLESFGKLSLVGESFSVIKFRPHGHTGEDFDIAIPREDRKVGEGHKGFEIVTEGVDIMGDLKRRDFTINSMAVNVMTGELLDPFNGKKDLENKLIRATDKNAFIEDPLRILRGIQFASRFDFDIEKGTKELMKQNSELVTQITGERILEEFQKILLKSGNTQRAFNLIHETDLDLALFNKKMIHYKKGFNELDPISFYFILGVVGGVNPTEFYVKRLKGETKMAKAITTLDMILDRWHSLYEDEDKKYVIFRALQKSPEVAQAVLLPKDAQKIIKEMKSGKIPAVPQDIAINGNDIMLLLNIKGEQVGFIKERIERDALMNKFDWKNRDECIEYIQRIVK